MPAIGPFFWEERERTCRESYNAMAGDNEEARRESEGLCEWENNSKQNETD
jgi:hypothetical protein